jgi:hypothetical protein
MASNPVKFIRFGDSYGPKPYKFMRGLVMAMAPKFINVYGLVIAVAQNPTNV